MLRWCAACHGTGAIPPAPHAPLSECPPFVPGVGGCRRATVIHVKDRRAVPRGLYKAVHRPTKWGNPFVVGRDGTRDEVIARHAAWLRQWMPALVEDARRELPGKVLGCYCAPLPCHAETWAAIANGEWEAGGTCSSPPRLASKLTHYPA